MLVLAGSVWAQAPRVGAIEIFGLRQVPTERVTRALGVKTGDPLPHSKGDAELRLAAVDGLTGARLEAFCCDQGKTILYVGVTENETEWRAEPEGEAMLPEEVRTAYAEYQSAYARASASGPPKEDFSKGHALSEEILCRVAQQNFVLLSERYQDDLRLVLSDSGDDDQRAQAATILGYSKQKQLISPALVNALGDPSPLVRAAAAHSLRGLGTLAKANPELKLRPGWFIPALSSPSLEERLQATEALLLAFDPGDDTAATLLKNNALTPLFEMARFRYAPHARPALLLLARLAGMPESDITTAPREKTLPVLERALRHK